LTRPLGSGSREDNMDPWSRRRRQRCLDRLRRHRTRNRLQLTIGSDHQRPTWIQESDPSASSTCDNSRQTPDVVVSRLPTRGLGASARVASILQDRGRCIPGIRRAQTSGHLQPTTPSRERSQCVLGIARSDSLGVAHRRCAQLIPTSQSIFRVIQWAANAASLGKACRVDRLAVRL